MRIARARHRRRLSAKLRRPRCSLQLVSVHWGGCEIRSGCAADRCYRFGEPVCYLSPVYESGPSIPVLFRQSPCYVLAGSGLMHRMSPIRPVASLVPGS